MPSLVLVERLATPLIAVDDDGAIGYTNDAFVELVGHPRDALTTMALRTLLASVPLGTCGVVAALRAHAGSVVKLTHADGWAISAMMSDSALLRHDDRVAMMTFTDISEHLWSTKRQAAGRVENGPADRPRPPWSVRRSPRDPSPVHHIDAATADSRATWTEDTRDDEEQIPRRPRMPMRARHFQVTEREDAIIDYLCNLDDPMAGATVPEIYRAIAESGAHLPGSDGLFTDTVSIAVYYKIIRRLAAIGRLEEHLSAAAREGSRYTFVSSSSSDALLTRADDTG